YLVTVIEKLMPSRYFSDGLSAAQADQLVLKELIQNKLPLLNEHLLSNDIDVTIVTFNWFLTLFIDALPTESMLRIIDVFLFEGRKVLFRVSLSILKLYERRILSMVDPVTIFQFIKEVAKHIFNVEELFKVAFNDFEPFPRRNTIASKCQPFATQFYEEYQERLKQKRKSQLLAPANKPSQPSLTLTPSLKI
ncbi:PREDICTED: TBC1 domain family member 2A-like, partial [Amphimedon queenslandica]|uniref:Rab-GAP TBC domain-containing protein n=1 Tax=Amphimedon queenslandica TaxID=400682 RepID=A0AAN0IS47_AMPQE